MDDVLVCQTSVKIQKLFMQSLGLNLQWDLSLYRKLLSPIWGARKLLRSTTDRKIQRDAEASFLEGCATVFLQWEKKEKKKKGDR